MHIKLSAFVFALAILMTAAPDGPVTAQTTKDEKVVKNGSVVSLEYTLTGEDGKLIESNKGRAAFKYTHGAQQMIPGLEKELAGMKTGGEKHVTVKPEDAYGSVRQEAFQEFPKEKIPPEALKVGTILTARGPQGEAIPVKVHEIKEKTVVLDFNHPMAGKILVFDVKILDIQPVPSPQPAQPAKPSAPPQPAKPTQPAQAQ